MLLFTFDWVEKDSYCGLDNDDDDDGSTTYDVPGAFTFYVCSGAGIDDGVYATGP